MGIRFYGGENTVQVVFSLFRRSLPEALPPSEPIE
jgi:hypothetical protein